MKRWLVVLMLAGCQAAPVATPPSEGVRSLEKARQALTAGRAAEAADSARQALTFLEIQDRSRLNAARTVLADALVAQKDYLTALRYYREAGADTRALCARLARPHLERARQQLARRGDQFTRTNALLEAGEALGQAQELLAEAHDPRLSQEGDRLAAAVQRERNRILPSARPAPAGKRRSSPFGGGPQAASGPPLFTHPWKPGGARRADGLELTDFTASPGVFGVSQARGTVRNLSDHELEPEVTLFVISEPNYRHLLATAPGVVADEAALRQRASRLRFSVGRLGAGAERHFEEKFETGLPVDVTVGLRSQSGKPSRSESLSPSSRQP